MMTLEHIANGTAFLFHRVTGSDGAIHWEEQDLAQQVLHEVPPTIIPPVAALLLNVRLLSL